MTEPLIGTMNTHIKVNDAVKVIPTTEIAIVDRIEGNYCMVSGYWYHINELIKLEDQNDKARISCTAISIF